MIRTPYHLEVQRTARDYANWHRQARIFGTDFYGLLASKASLELACAQARVDRRRRGYDPRFAEWWNQRPQL